MGNLHVVRVDRNFKKGGGIILIFDPIFNYSIENNISDPALELVHITIFKQFMKPINIIVGYRAPNSSADSFFNILYNFLCNINISFPFLIMGDFNIDFSCNNATCKRFISLLNTFGFTGINNSPTRISSTSSTLIDIIATNLPEQFSTPDSIPCSFSDHNFIYFNYKKVKHVPKKQSSTIKYIPKRNYDSYCSDINSSLLASPNIHDVNDISIHTISTISDIFERHSCQRQVTLIDFSTNPWYTPTIQHYAKLKDNAFIKYRSTNNHQDLTVYKQMKNTLNQLIIQSKREYFEKKVFSMVSLNPKKAWKHIKPLIDSASKPHQSINLIHYKGEDITDEASIADAFGSYFHDIIKEIGRSFDSANIRPILFRTLPLCTGSFHFKLLNIDMVKECILKSKINNKQYKLTKNLCLPALAHRLTCLINQCILNSSFPDNMKNAVITPHYKSGKHNLVQNYRPVSTLPDIGKVLERCISDQINHHLNQHNLITLSQHGFRKNHNTLCASLCFLDCIYKALDSGLTVVALFLDFSKAFDTLNHEILYNKLIHLYGFDTRAADLIRSYMAKRTYQVKVNDSYSRHYPLETGVPQGSLLGPLLFTIYINDIICYVPLDTKSFIYADDTTLLFIKKNMTDVEDSINNNLRNVDLYSKNNKLKLNISKTKIMCFRNNHPDFHLNISFQDTSIELVNQFKFLGFHLDSALSLSIHCQHIIAKLNLCSYVLNRCKKFLNRHLLKLIFNSIGLSYINYFAVIAKSCNTSDLNKIEAKYNHCGSIIYNCFYNSLHHYNWLKLKDLLQFMQLSFLFKVIKNGFAPCIADVIVELKDCKYNLRNNIVTLVLSDLIGLLVKNALPIGGETNGILLAMISKL